MNNNNHVSDLIKFKEFFVTDFYEPVTILLDNGVDVSTTGNLHLNIWQYHNKHLGYPGQNHITNILPSKGGYGAGGDISPLATACAVFDKGGDSMLTIQVRIRVM